MHQQIIGQGAKQRDHSSSGQQMLQIGTPFVSQRVVGPFSIQEDTRMRGLVLHELDAGEECGWIVDRLRRVDHT